MRNDTKESSLSSFLKYTRNITFIALLYVIDFLFITGNVKRKDKTLLIVKTDGIGDYVLFRNFLGIIRSSDKFKDFKITLLGDGIDSGIG